MKIELLQILVNVASNRDLKSFYSWLPIGRTSKIVNDRTWGRCTLIAAIFSDGSYLWLISKDTINSPEFRDFIMVMNYLIKSCKHLFKDKITITMDNASPHRSIDTLNKLKELDIKVFLPPYSPNLAPVEYFFRIIKGKMRKHHLNSNVNFKNLIRIRNI